MAPLAGISAMAACVSTMFAAPPRPTAQLASITQVTKALGIGEGQILGAATSRLNGDKTAKTIVITCRTVEKGHPLGGEVVVLEPARTSGTTRRSSGGSPPLRVVWRHRNLNPWKLAVADVDGDGRKEVAVGVWKKSPKDPVMAKRTFFYTWNGRRLLPKWLGSRLSRRFDDFALADINGDGWDELVALEVAPKGRHRISAYRWHSFGFEWLGCTPEVPGLARLDAAKGRVVASGKGTRAVVSIARGKVVLTRLSGRR